MSLSWSISAGAASWRNKPNIALKEKLLGHGRPDYAPATASFCPAGRCGDAGGASGVRKSNRMIHPDTLAVTP
jgi:hypothetical protein